METSTQSESITPVELSIAGWFVVVAAAVELCFGRLSAFLGLYLGVGSSGPRAVLANAGALAMYAAGIASLSVLLGVLPAVLSDGRFRGVLWRGVLILISPVYLLVTALAVFAPRLSPWLVFAAYLAAVAMATVLACAAAAAPVEKGVRRIVMALGAANLLQVFGWTTLDFFPVDRESVLGEIAIRAYLVAEAIWVAAPFAAFVGLVVNSRERARAYLRRPHLFGLLLAVAALAIGIATVLRTSGQGAYLAQVSYLTFGVTLSIPGAPWLYVASAFFAALTVGSLALPSPGRPVDGASRRLGFGLALIWISGLQPYRVFQFALMLLGFALVARGAVGRLRPSAAPRVADEPLP